MANVLLHELNYQDVTQYIEPFTLKSRHTFRFEPIYDATFVEDNAPWADIGSHDEFSYVLRYSEELYEVLSRQYALEPRKSLSIQDYHQRLKHQYIYAKRSILEFKPDVLLLGNFPHDSISCILVAICAYNSIPYYVLASVVFSPTFTLVPGNGRENPFSWSFSNCICPAPDPSLDSARKSLNTSRCIDDFLSQLIDGGNYPSLPPRQVANLPSARSILKASGSPFKLIKHLAWGAWVIKKQNRFEKFMKTLEAKFDAKSQGPYIFYPLHLQPEMATSALGGVFYNDQFICIYLLSKLAKKHGLSLVLKEHYMQSHSHRNIADIAALSTLKNVLFAPRSLSTHELIKRSVMVASISGTAGFEALYYGKKSLVLGTSWYQEMPGVFSEIDEADEYLSQLESFSDYSQYKSLDTQEAVIQRRNCLEMLEEYSSKAWPGTTWTFNIADQFVMDPHLNAKTLFGSIEKILEMLEY